MGNNTNQFEGVVIFVKVVELESFSKAAEYFGFSASHISKEINKLEDRLAVRLLNRTTRRLSLTEAGSTYFAHAMKMLNQVEFAETAITELSGTPSGLLKISASIAIGQHLLAPLLPQFLKENSKVNIQLVPTNRVINIIEDGFDIVVRVGQLKDSNLISKRIATTRLKLYASKDFLEKNGEPQTAEELRHFNCLSMVNNSNINSWKLISNGTEQEYQINTRAYVYDFTMLKTLMTQGSGIALLPSYLGESDDIKTKVKRILPSWTSADIDFHLVYPSRHKIPPKTRAFINFIVKNFNVEY